MKSKLLLLALIILTVFITNAQPTIEWQKSLGGTDNDGAHSIQQTKDGGYIVAGHSKSNDEDVTGNHGWFDYWIVKSDSAGAIEWQKSLGGTGDDVANSIKQTKDGGYIVAGYSDSNDDDITGNHGDYDFWIVKLDSAGSIEWQKSLGGTGDDDAYSIQQTTDGGYIIVGNSNLNDGDVTGNHGYDDYWIVKLNSSGGIEWQKSLGGTGNDWANSIQQTTDGGYIVAGYSMSNDGDVTGNHGYLDCWIVKLDSAGGIEWQKSLGGTSYDYAISIQQTKDGGYIVAGSSNSNNGDVTGHHGTTYNNDDYWIVKLNNAGDIEWQKSLGGTGNDWAYSIQQTKEGGYIVLGTSSSNDGDVTGNHGSSDYWIVKLNNVGNIEWQKCLGGTGDDRARSIKQTKDGGYIVAGESYSDDGDVTGNHGYDDYWIVKLSPDVVNLNFTVSGTLQYDKTKSTPLKNVKLELVTLEGNIVKTTTTDTQGKYLIDSVSSGNYFINASSIENAGGIDPVDALLVNKSYMGASTLLNVLRTRAADVNADKSVNPTDAFLIYKNYIGIVTSFKAGNWLFERDTLKVENANVVRDIKGICVGDVNGSK